MFNVCVDRTNLLHPHLLLLLLWLSAWLLQWLLHLHLKHHHKHLHNHNNHNPYIHSYPTTITITTITVTVTVAIQHSRGSKFYATTFSYIIRAMQQRNLNACLTRIHTCTNANAQVRSYVFMPSNAGTCERMSTLLTVFGWIYMYMCLSMHSDMLVETLTLIMIHAPLPHDYGSSSPPLLFCHILVLSFFFVFFKNIDKVCTAAEHKLDTMSCATCLVLSWIRAS